MLLKDQRNVLKTREVAIKGTRKTAAWHATTERKMQEIEKEKRYIMLDIFIFDDST